MHDRISQTIITFDNRYNHQKEADKMINTISNFITVYRNQFLVAILISVILIFCSCFSSSTAFGKRNGKSFWRYKYFGYFDKSQFSPFAAGNECADYLLRYYLVTTKI